MIDNLKEFLEDWRVGFRLLMYIAVLGGLCIAAGALGGVIIFAVVVALPVGFLFQIGFPESYGAAAAVIGAAFWGVAMIGRYKGAFLEAINGEARHMPGSGS